jgi:hypothetical protein
MTLELKAARRHPQQEHPASDESPSFIEQRRETRYATNDPVEISVLEAGSSVRLGGTVLDVSRSGLRIETAIPISKGSRVEVMLPNRAIIFGKTRFCRRASDLYHAGLAIEEIYYAQPLSAEHIHDDEVALYAAGNGLTVLEAVRVKKHLVACKNCRARLAETEALLRPPGQYPS